MPRKVSNTFWMFLAIANPIGQDHIHRAGDIGLYLKRLRTDNISTMHFNSRRNP